MEWVKSLSCMAVCSVIAVDEIRVVDEVFMVALCSVVDVDVCAKM